MVGHIAHVRWAAHGREMSSFVSAVRNKEVYSDCLLCCKDGYQIPAHRAVLAMASPFFNTIFRSYPATGSTPCIVLEGVDRDQIDALLHYIYFGSLIVKCDRLPALSKTAKALDIKEFPSLEIAPPCPKYSSGREERRPQDNTLPERHSNRTGVDRALSGDFAETNSWSQSKKRKWTTDAPTVPIHAQDYLGASRSIGSSFARPMHNPTRVPVLKQLLSPPYCYYSERSHTIPSDFMQADLANRAARETIRITPDKTTTTPLNQNKISDEAVEIEDSDELVEVGRMDDDHTSEPRRLQHHSYSLSDSNFPGKKTDVWASSKTQRPIPQWHPDSILRTEPGRPRASSNAQDSAEGKASPPKKSSLTVNLAKSGSQSVSPRPVHSPLTPPANRPNSVPTAGLSSCSQGPYDLSLKSSSYVMPITTTERNSEHAKELHRQNNVEDVGNLKQEKSAEEFAKLTRLSTVNPKNGDTDSKQEINNMKNIMSSDPSGVKVNKYDDKILLKSRRDDIKPNSLKYQNIRHSYNSTSANADEEKCSNVSSEEETTSKTSLIYTNTNGTVTSASTSNSTKPGPKNGPPALLSIVNGTNGWKLRETSTLLHRSSIIDPSPNQKHYPQPHSLQRSPYIPLNSIAPRIEKFCINSESYGSRNLPEKKYDTPEETTSVILPESSFRSPKERKYLKSESSELKLERESSEASPAGSTNTEIPVTDPLLTKISTTKRRRVRGPKSWEYLLRLLRDPSTNPTLIRWENEQEGIFRLVKPDAIALRWGKRTGKHCTDMLSYENFARGLRYHYVTGALSAVSERCFVYKFGPKAEKALKYSDCSGDVMVAAEIVSGLPVTEVI